MDGRVKPGHDDGVFKLRHYPGFLILNEPSGCYDLKCAERCKELGGTVGKVISVIALFAAIASVAIVGPAFADTLTIIHAGRLIDGVSKTPRAKMSIVINGDRVQSVEPGFITRPNAKIIDLSNATVLPGLIDCHVHLTATFDGGNVVAEQVTRTAFNDAFDSVAYARRTLLAGFTSVRDVGGALSVVVALRDAIKKGHIVGPRMWVSGDPLGPTGGHGDPRDGLDPLLSHAGWDDQVIDGADEARKAVRRYKRSGADLIKIMPSGGVFSANDDPQALLMTDDEIKIVVETAHALGMKVAAHAHGKLAIDRAIKLGVDSIEHGTFGDAGSYGLYRSHGTYLVPTLLVAQVLLDVVRKNPAGLNPSSVKKALDTAPRMQSNLGNAYRAGVKIAFGTDQFISPHGQNAKEFPLLVQAGMKPIDAIFAATANAADLIGDAKDIGSIRAGRYADIVAVKPDPLANIAALEKMDFVMKSGVVYKWNGTPTAAGIQ